jgi:hypothetical protein
MSVQRHFQMFATKSALEPTNSRLLQLSGKQMTSVTSPVLPTPFYFLAATMYLIEGFCAVFYLRLFYFAGYLKQFLFCTVQSPCTRKTPIGFELEPGKRKTKKLFN